MRPWYMWAVFGSRLWFGDFEMSIVFPSLQWKSQHLSKTISGMAHEWYRSLESFWVWNFWYHNFLEPSSSLITPAIVDEWTSISSIPWCISVENLSFLFSPPFNAGSCDLMAWSRIRNKVVTQFLSDIKPPSETILCILPSERGILML